MKGIKDQALAAEDELVEERAHMRALRHVLTSGSAILGVVPFTRALAPTFVPRLVAGLSALWAALICTLVAVGVQELLLWSSALRMRRATSSTSRP